MTMTEMKQQIAAKMAQAEALVQAVKYGTAAAGAQDQIEALSNEIETLSDDLYAAGPSAYIARYGNLLGYRMQ